MFTSRLVALLLATGSAYAEGPNLGTPLKPGDLATWSINVLPDGTNLPKGSGTMAQGAPIYAQKCAMCHGPNGKDGNNAALVGQPPIRSIEGPRLIANFWPYSTTVFDYIRRAMPWTQPRSLTDDEVYALTAYILALNKLIGEKDVMNAQTLPKVKMPNRDNFIPRFPQLLPQGADKDL